MKITSEQIKIFFNRGKNVEELNNTNEHSFKIPVNKCEGIEVQIYTSVKKDENGKPLNHNVFRIFAVDIKNGKGFIKTRTVLHKHDWKIKLKTTINSVYKTAQWRFKMHNK